MSEFFGRKKEILESVWSVISTFGFTEGEEKRGFNITEKSIECRNNCSTVKAYAEMAAILIEAVIVNGLENFCVKVNSESVYDLLVLFGFEKIVKMDSEIKDGFFAEAFGKIFAKGFFKKDSCGFSLDTEKFFDVLKEEGVDMSETDSVKSLILAEEDAEGLAYDIAYNLRVNGCVIEYYNFDGDIQKAEEYARKEGHLDILRVYPDGKIMIKNFIKNEIIETSYDEFLGYYEDDHGECDCGHHHEHGEDCSCHSH